MHFLKIELENVGRKGIKGNAQKKTHEDELERRQERSYFKRFDETCKQQKSPLMGALC